MAVQTVGALQLWSPHACSFMLPLGHLLLRPLAAKVTVIDSVGRVLPIILGVKVHREARCNAIIEAIKPQLHPPFDAAIETLLVTETYGMAYYSDSVPRLIPESTEMNDRFHLSHQLILYRQGLPWEQGACRAQGGRVGQGWGGTWV